MSGTALVVGGGIAGLLSARRLHQAGWDVTLAEATSVLGGALSSRFLDVPSISQSGTGCTQALELDGGAESFAVRGTAVRDLLEELGLGGRIVAPAPLGSWLHGPEATVPAPRLGLLGIPGDLDADDLARALSPAGLERARADAHAPMDRWTEALAAGRPVTVAELVADRMGEEVLTRLVGPVVGGVHSADPAVVDVERVAPGLLAAAVAQGGLAAGVAALRGGATPGAAVAGLEGGMNRLTTRLVESLREDGVTVLRGVRVAALSRVGEGWWAQISDRDDEVVRGLDVDRVVLAVDGSTAWDLLSPLSHGVLGEADGPALSDGVALATFVVDAPGLDAAPRGTGVLVAEGTDVAAKALTHATVKWDWLRDVVARPGADGEPRHPHRHVLRLSYGRHGGGDEQLGPRSGDEELLTQGLADAAALTGVPLAEQDVVARAVTRWRHSIPPQAGPDREATDALLAWAAPVPGLDAVGSWVHGTGLAAIVAGVEAVFAADGARADLDATTKNDETNEDGTP
ncbi:FAD-dependent oxidoreductase [Micrococcus sp. NPDC078436]|uniref:protoporphyrinogen/coproporphyrinogen oxidase n=1 Tax=Micrococcus sp. NPDC078436 TaxID=3154960 RepID=UPI00344E6BC8